MLKGAIFDLDGTLIDSMFIWDTAGETYLNSIGIKPQEDIRNVLKPMSLLQAAVYIHDKYSLLLSVEEIMDGINHTVEDFYFHTVKPKKGVTELLEQLKKQGIKMCIATATDRYQVEAVLKRCGMEKFFSEIFTCTEIGHGKDEPDIFRKAIEHLGATKSEAIVFEDAYYALKTAKSDGFITVAVYDSYEPRQSELRAIADCCIEDFTQTEHFWKFANGI